MEIREKYRILTKLLIQKELTITTMESATSGQIASLITDTEGSSAVLKGAFITYCNEAKIQYGVPAEIIETYTVYSKETAKAMAEACQKAYGADIGIGVTGTMGNVDPAGVLRMGSKEMVREATLSVMENCCSYPNFVISSGCDIPPMTPWENIQAFFEAVDEYYGK